jgi:UrcA family protein
MVAQHRCSRGRPLVLIRTIDVGAGDHERKATETIMKRIITLAALVAAPLFAPALAQAPASADRVQIVSYADLDLSKEADVRKLDRRVRAAVKNVCGAASDVDVAGKNEVRRCRTITSERLSLERAIAIASAARPGRVALASGE